jgi:hypothetical protein
VKRVKRRTEEAGKSGKETDGIKSDIANVKKWACIPQQSS